jgi:hypothetical protein
MIACMSWSQGRKYPGTDMLRKYSVFCIAQVSTHEYNISKSILALRSEEAAWEQQCRLSFLMVCLSVLL